MDALSPDGESFGIERLSDVVASAPARPEILIDQVVDALRDFTEGTEPYDDVTLVAIACDREVV